MILVRNIFRLKFGKAKEAMSVWKEMLPAMKKSAPGADSIRLLTDVVGPYYTLVMEMTYKSLEEFERNYKENVPSQTWKEGYQKFVPLVDSGYREIFNIES